MENVLMLHSLVRYVVIIAAVIGLVKTSYDSLTKKASDTIDPILASIFVGLIDLQTLLGVLIIFLGGLRGPLHPLLMFVALVIAHGVNSAVKRSTGGNVMTLRLALYLVPLLIILFGLLIIGQLRV